MPEFLEMSGFEIISHHLQAMSQKRAEVKDSAALPRREIYNIIIDVLLQYVLDKLFDLDIDLAEKVVVDRLETCDFRHNKRFVESALWCALKNLFMSILENKSGTREPSYYHLSPQ